MHFESSKIVTTSLTAQVTSEAGSGVERRILLRADEPASTGKHSDNSLPRNSRRAITSISCCLCWNRTLKPASTPAGFWPHMNALAPSTARRSRSLYQAPNRPLSRWTGRCWHRPPADRSLDHVVESVQRYKEAQLSAIGAKVDQTEQRIPDPHCAQYERCCAAAALVDRQICGPWPIAAATGIALRA